MKKRYLIDVVSGLLLFLLILPIVFGSVSSYFNDRMNFPPGESRLHQHDITFSGNLTITKPSAFGLAGASGTPSIAGDNISWDSAVSITVYLNLTSPAACTEGERYIAGIYLNGSLVDEFIYVCTPDDKVLDWKVEYGHGDGNYLSDPYISNDTITLFNLLRVWNIGHYLVPNEDAEDARMRCYFEDYTVRTHGHGDLFYNGSSPVMDFAWDYIYGGYWFRIGVLSQDFTGKPVGDFYNVSCSELVYDFDHQQVRVPGMNYSLEVRSCDALQISFADYPEDVSKIRVEVKNIEKYPLFDLYFKKIVDGFSEEQHVIQLFTGEIAGFLTDRNNTYNFTFSFIPSWYRNSLKPQYCVQSFFFNGSMAPMIGPALIPDITILEDSVYTGLDLDDYVADPDDPDASLNWTTSPAENLTIDIDNITHMLTVTPDADWNGTRIVWFTVTDPNGLSDNQSVTIIVLPSLDPPFISPQIPDYYRAPGSGPFNIDLGNHENGDDDDDAGLVWSALGVDGWCINISINQATDIATITPLAEWSCQDMVTFVLTDNDNLTDQQEVEIRYNATLELIKGWNLISFPPLKDMGVMTVLAPLGNGNFGCGRNSTNISYCNVSNNDFNGTWNSVQTYNTTSGQFLVFNPTDYYLTIPGGQEFQEFSVLRGYWIEMTDNNTLELDFDN